MNEHRNILIYYKIKYYSVNIHYINIYICIYTFQMFCVIENQHKLGIGSNRFIKTNIWKIILIIYVSEWLSIIITLYYSHAFYFRYKTFNCI